ncbi:hypothetical protein EHQ64_12660 [Leptospira sarikeiensis]|uniref:Uncharacterized protein n=2 Tax=Leptospira sarikeiensis TaxID=2484943 RepID=A0A4R9K6X6_9LEPT|nr:hypothetical protein EHQ64_12660 [Leptospira sarikeiensis]
MLSCFPDMVRKKKTENDWFKLEKVDYVVEGKKLGIVISATVKNPYVESVEVYELQDEEKDILLFKKDKPIQAGKLLLKAEIKISENKDWIRKIGTTRKWIRVELKNDTDLINHLQTEVLVHESDKKQFRKNLSIEAEGEIIHLDGREWKLISDIDRIDQALLQYIPKSDPFLLWNEMLSIHVYKVRTSSPLEIYSLLESGKKKECSNLNWASESQNSDRISYYWEHSGCGKQAASSQIAKLFRGEFGIYNIRYDKKGKISIEDRRKWSSLLDSIPGK